MNNSNKPEKYSKKRRFGNSGEDYVVKDLETKGFTIITRNYLRKWGEIDIVAVKGNKLHFIEVKTVSKRGDADNDGWKPEENVHPYKLRKMGRTIETFLIEEGSRLPEDWQCDVACVYIVGKTDENNEKILIEYLEDIIIER